MGTPECQFSDQPGKGHPEGHTDRLRLRDYPQPIDRRRTNERRGRYQRGGIGYKFPADFRISYARRTGNGSAWTIDLAAEINRRYAGGDGNVSCIGGQRGDLRPDYFCVATSWPFSTLMPPTSSGSFRRSRCSVSFFCSAPLTSDNGTFRSPTLNSVGSKVA